MTKVFIYNLNGVEFFVREEQRGALNEALEAKGLAKCEAEHFDFQEDFEFNVSTQPHKQEKKVFVPCEYKSEDFLLLLDEKNPIAYLTKDVVDEGKKVEAEVVSDEADKPKSKIVVKEDPITKLNKQIAKQAEKLKDAKFVADNKKGNLSKSVQDITASFSTQIQTFQDFITPKFLEDAGLMKDLGKDLPIEDIDKIYFVHCEGKLDETVGNKKKAVVKLLETRSKSGN